MSKAPLLAVWLWFAYAAWCDNGFKNIDADGSVFRPRPSVSRMRRLRVDDYGTRMSMLNDYKSGSVTHAERKDRGA